MLDTIRQPAAHSFAFVAHDGLFGCSAKGLSVALDGRDCGGCPLAAAVLRNDVKVEMLRGYAIAVTFRVVTHNAHLHQTIPYMALLMP